jgi:hypothetical protein
MGHHPPPLQLAEAQGTGAARSAGPACTTYAIATTLVAVVGG